MLTQNPLILYLLFSLQFALILLRYVYFYCVALPYRYLFLKKDVWKRNDADDDASSNGRTLFLPIQQKSGKFAVWKRFFCGYFSKKAIVATPEMLAGRFIDLVYEPFQRDISQWKVLREKHSCTNMPCNPFYDEYLGLENLPYESHQEEISSNLSIHHMCHLCGRQPAEGRVKNHLIFLCSPSKVTSKLLSLKEESTLPLRESNTQEPCELCGPTANPNHLKVSVMATREKKPHVLSISPMYRRGDSSPSELLPPKGSSEEDDSENSPSCSISMPSESKEACISLSTMRNSDVRRGYSDSVQQMTVRGVDDFPERAIIKSKTRNFAFELLDLTIREVQIMNLLSRSDPMRPKETNSGVLMPHVFYSNYHYITHEQVLLMEDLTLRNFKCLNIEQSEYCESKHLAKLILSQLARMHAKWMNCDSLPKKNPFILLSSMHTNLASQWCHVLWKKMRQQFASSEPDIAELGDLCTTSNLAHILLTRGKRLYPQTLSHGDCNLTNIFWRKNDDCITICDWSNAQYGLWIFDVQYLLSFNFSSRLMNECEEELLRFYQEELILHLTRYQREIPEEVRNFSEIVRIYQEQMYFMFFAMIFVCFETEKKKGDKVREDHYCHLMRDRVCHTLRRCRTIDHVRKIFEGCPRELV